MIGIPTKDVLPKPAHIIKAPISDFDQFNFLPKKLKNKTARMIFNQGTMTGKMTGKFRTIFGI
jgi:hypothetical protein